MIEDKVTSRAKKLQEVFDETELTALHDLGYVATVNWVERFIMRIMRIIYLDHITNTEIL